MYITKYDLLVNMLNSRSPLHFAANRKIGQNVHNLKIIF